MNKLIGLLIVFLVYSVRIGYCQPKINTLSQIKHYEILNDTFVLKGYLILLTQKHFLSKQYNTYFGFISDSSIKGDSSFEVLVSKSNTNGMLKKILKKFKNFLSNKMELAVIPWNENTVNLIYLNEKDISVSKKMIQLINNAPLSLPSISSYGIPSNTCKPLYSIKAVTLHCLIIRYDSFKWYHKEQIIDYVNGIPPLHNPLRFGFEFPINIMPIKNAKKENGYYVLIPYASVK